MYKLTNYFFTSGLKFVSTSSSKITESIFLFPSLLFIVSARQMNPDHQFEKNGMDMLLYYKKIYSMWPIQCGHFALRPLMWRPPTWKSVLYYTNWKKSRTPFSPKFSHALPVKNEFWWNWHGPNFITSW